MSIDRYSSQTTFEALTDLSVARPAGPVGHVQFGYHRYSHRQPDGTWTALCVCGWKWTGNPDLATAVAILAGHGDTTPRSRIVGRS